MGKGKSDRMPNVDIAMVKRLLNYFGYEETNKGKGDHHKWVFPELKFFNIEIPDRKKGSVSGNVYLEVIRQVVALHMITGQDLTRLEKKEFKVFQDFMSTLNGGGYLTFLSSELSRILKESEHDALRGNGDYKPFFDKMRSDYLRNKGEGSSGK